MSKISFFDKPFKKSKKYFHDWYIFCFRNLKKFWYMTWSCNSLYFWLVIIFCLLIRFCINFTHLFDLFLVDWVSELSHYFFYNVSTDIFTVIGLTISLFFLKMVSFFTNSFFFLLFFFFLLTCINNLLIYYFLLCLFFLFFLFPLILIFILKLTKLIKTIIRFLNIKFN
jgi:hypothetical protein